MSRVTIHPESRDHWLSLRRQDVTSTDVAALFSCSPYDTHYSLWMKKAGRLIDDVEETERMRWGKRLQSAIAEGVCEDNGWQQRPMTEYMRIPELRAGSSFDHRIIDPFDAGLEIKCVDSYAFKEGWIVHNDEAEAPPHIELQAQHQMLVSGLRVNYIAALIGGNRVSLTRREAIDSIHDEIVDRVAAFWRSIDRNEPPSPDFRRDYEAIRAIHPSIKGETITAGVDAPLSALIRRYAEQSARAAAANADVEATKAEIAHILGERPGAESPEGKILRYPVKATTYTVNKKAQVQMRITPKGEKS